MSNLLTGIPPAASLVAQSTPQTVAQGARGAEGNVAQAAANQRIVASGAASNPAVLVSLSADARARVPSYGAGRSVDASFEKQELEERLLTKEEKDSGQKGSRSQTVKVTA